MSDYITPQQLAAEVGTDGTRDAMKLASAATAASRQVEQFCGRRFWQDPTAVSREFYAECSTYCDLLDQPNSEPKVEISTDSGLIVEVDTGCDGTFATDLTDGTDFVLLPRSAEADGRPWSAIQIVGGSTYLPIISNGRAGVRITARFGWPAVPEEVVRATMLQAVMLFKAKDAPLGMVQFGADGGGMRLSGGLLHPTAAALLRPYQRPPIG